MLQFNSVTGLTEFVIWGLCLERGMCVCVVLGVWESDRIRVEVVLWCSCTGIVSSTERSLWRDKLQGLSQGFDIRMRNGSTKWKGFAESCKLLILAPRGIEVLQEILKAWKTWGKNQGKLGRLDKLEDLKTEQPICSKTGKCQPWQLPK